MEKEIATTREPAECKNAGKRGKKTKGNLFVRFLPLYLMLLPLVVYLFIFNYYPMFGLQIAFKDWFVRKGIWGSRGRRRTENLICSSIFRSCSERLFLKKN